VTLQNICNTGYLYIVHLPKYKINVIEGNGSLKSSTTNFLSCVG